MNDIEPTNATEGAKRNAMIDELRAFLGCPDHETNAAIVALIRSGDETKLAKMEAIVVAHGFNFARFCAKSLQNDTENEQAKACFERDIIQSVAAGLRPRYSQSIPLVERDNPSAIPRRVEWEGITGRPYRSGRGSRP